MGLLGKRVHLAQYLAHISPCISPNTPEDLVNMFLQPAGQACFLKMVGVPRGLPVSQHICVSTGLFNLHVLKHSCSHIKTARACAKEGKTEANHGLCCGLSILLAKIGSRCAIGMMWDLLFVGLGKRCAVWMMWFLAFAVGRHAHSYRGSTVRAHATVC